MVKTRDEKVNHLQTGIDEMESAIDENEQHSMRNSLRINGVPNILGVTLKFINKELGLLLLPWLVPSSGVAGRYS